MPNYDVMRDCVEVFENNRVLTSSEVREFQDFISATSCDNDDDIPDRPEFEEYGMRTIDQAELTNWALFGDCSKDENEEE